MIEYKTLHASSSEDLDLLVNECSWDGWEINGSPYSVGYKFYQSMTMVGMRETVREDVGQYILDLDFGGIEHSGERFNDEHLSIIAGNTKLSKRAIDLTQDDIICGRYVLEALAKYYKVDIETFFW